MRVSYDADVDHGALDRATIAIVGYGSQGRAHALNLRDAGRRVVVALRPGSPSREAAHRDGIAVEDVATAVAGADVVMLLLPDEEQGAVYTREIRDAIPRGATLAFAHGFAIHYGTIAPREDLDVIMIAPKGPGRLVREEYAAGRGVPALIAVHADRSGRARATAAAYAASIGAGRAGIIETTFREEVETDLFGEQAVLCGGLSQLVTAGFETLVGAGYAPEMAYFECLHEVKLIVDLMYARGIEGMRDAISNTAKYGDYTRGPQVIGPETRRAMQGILASIRDGSFAAEWIAEHAAGKPSFNAHRARAAAHEIESVGAELRGLMPWMRDAGAEREPAAAGR